MKKKLNLKDLDFLPGGDPGGRLFKYNGELFRGIAKTMVDKYKGIVEHKDFNNLFELGLVPTEPTGYFTEEYPLILKHKTISPVTFPFEWCGDMLKQASLFHCHFVKKVLPLNIWVKDSHNYNILFDYSSDTYFIDFCSLMPLDNPGRAPLHEEFNRYCINPLYLMEGKFLKEARHLINMGGYETGTQKGGVDNQEVLELIRDKRGDTYRLYREREEDYRKEKKWIDLLDMYIEEIENISIEFGKTIWETYYDVSERYPTNVRFRHFVPDSLWEPKQIFLYNYFSKSNCQTVLDIGCSAGWFSKLAALSGKKVIALDNDDAALQRVYREALKEKLPIHPVYLDFSNINYLYHGEELKRIERFRSDIVLGLALVHHLVFRYRMSFGEIVKTLYRLTNNTLILEFIDDDSIATFQEKTNIPWYSRENLEKELKKYFKHIKIEDSAGHYLRFLFVCSEKKKLTWRSNS